MLLRESKVTFELKILKQIPPSQIFCSVCGTNFDIGDLVAEVIMANGQVTLIIDDSCLDQFQGFITLAVLNREGMESPEVPSRVN